LVERYWAEAAALTPWYAWGGADMQFGEIPAENIAPQTLADSLAIERRYMASVSTVQRSSLDTQSKLTYDIFARERSLAIEGFTYPLELMPINPYEGMPQAFALSASGAERLAISSAQEFEHWRTRALRFVDWTNQAIVNMRAGLRRGYTVPRILIGETLPELAALGDDTPSNVFYEALRSGSGGTAAEDARLTAAVRTVLKENLLPSYRALHDFLQREYLPRTRTSTAWSALPLGNAWYAYILRRTTGSAATQADLHALGVAEVERLQQRVRSLLSEASFPGDAQGFYERMRGDPRFSHKDGAELLSAYQTLKVEVADAAPSLFIAVPRAEFGIRSVEPYREAVAPRLSYSPRAPNGLTPAVLYVDTAARGERQPMVLPAQYLREAVPGHHYQFELQRERADLPRFRRFGGAPAFVEGWGLYAAALGEELNVYRDPEAKFSSLLGQLGCALGLVLDTGLHAQAWNRQQALDYLHAHMPIDDDDAVKTVDRVIALPGKAVACTVGFLKIQGLRTRAQQALGAGFDLRAFNTEIIDDGAMPLDVLEAKMNSWLAAGAVGRGASAGDAVAGSAPAGDGRPPSGAPE
jgi:uncharacterized protein (DUF885 family)